MSRARVSKIVLMIALIIGILAVPSTILAQQGKDKDKVDICHIDEDGQVIPITIAPSAVEPLPADGYFPPVKVPVQYARNITGRRQQNLEAGLRFS